MIFFLLLSLLKLSNACSTFGFGYYRSYARVLEPVQITVIRIYVMHSDDVFMRLINSNTTGPMLTRFFQTCPRCPEKI